MHHVYKATLKDGGSNEFQTNIRTDNSMSNTDLYYTEHRNSLDTTCFLDD